MVITIKTAPGTANTKGGLQGQIALQAVCPSILSKMGGLSSDRSGKG